MATATIQCTLGQPPGLFQEFPTAYNPLLPLSNPLAGSLKVPFFSTNACSLPGSTSATTEPSPCTLTSNSWQHGTINPGILPSGDNSTRSPSTSSAGAANAGSPAAVDSSNSDRQMLSPKSTKPANNDRARKSSTKRASASKKRAVTDARPAQERAKREDMLRKNREAAHKCRAKKKDWMGRIDEQHRNLAARNKFLRAELDVLKESVFELKDLVLQHTDCGYAPIEAYLQTAVADVQARVRSRSYPEVHHQQQARPPPPPSAPAHGSSRSTSVTSYSTDMSEYDRMSSRSWTDPGDRVSSDTRSLPKIPEGYGYGHVWMNNLQRS